MVPELVNQAVDFEQEVRLRDQLVLLVDRLRQASVALPTHQGRLNRPHLLHAFDQMRRVC